ncbi:MAG: hypothetical protein ACF8LL_06455, partial [Phycisphaerales bacterium]
YWSSPTAKAFFVSLREYDPSLPLVPPSLPSAPMSEIHFLTQYVMSLEEKAFDQEPDAYGNIAEHPYFRACWVAWWQLGFLNQREQAVALEGAAESTNEHAGDST